MTTTETKTTKTKGTCGACFATVALNANGRIVRHGWREQGKRKVGQHGRAWHTGPCFGTDRRPYEAGTATTEEYLAKVVFPAAMRAQTEIDRLAAKPTLYVEVRTSVRRDASVATVRLTPQDREEYALHLCREEAGLTPWILFSAPSYARTLAARTSDAVALLADVSATGALCVEKISSWA